MRKFFTFLTFFLFYVSFLSAQTNRTVCATGCDYTTIAGAVAGSLAGDIISITDPVHTEQGITVDKNLTINSGDLVGTIIQANAASNTATDRVFNISAGVTVTMENLTIRHGRTSQGGGINNSGTLSLVNCTISSNVAVIPSASNGGGIYNLGTLSMTDCSVSDNLAYGYSTNTKSYGGGIFNNGTLSLNNSTFFGNLAHCFSSHGSSLSSAFGGGIYNNSGKIITMTNCTLSENVAKSQASYIYNSSGGGIYNNNGTITIMNGTISGNASDSYSASSATCTGGGIFTTGGSLTVTNTIIANNTALTNINLHGTPAASTFSICEGCTTGSWVSTADPMLVDLADNCGLTQTCAIAGAASPAIDAGTNTGAPSLDQRSRSRFNGVRDIGAYEYHGAPVSGSTLHTVCSSGCDFTTISAAIHSVCADDTISIMDAVHTEYGIDVDKDLIIKGGNAKGTIVQAHATAGSATDRVFFIKSGVTVMMNDLTVQHGRGKSKGGGIYNFGTLELTNCSISDNSLYHTYSNGNLTYGGGIYNEGTLTMTSCLIADNASNSGVYYNNYAGGICNNSTLTMVNCTVSGNYGAGHGGAFINYGVMELTNCTISDNASYESSGAFINNGTGSLVLTNCTFSDNVASLNNSGSTNLGTLDLTNTIIANKATTNLYNGGTITQANTICEGCTGSWFSTADPMIGTLNINCGDQQTCAIIDPASPAIDAGTSTGAPLLDQLGQSRVGAVDIGAYEFQGLTPVTGTDRPGAGYAVNLDGTDQYVDLPDGIVSTFSDFTFESWFYINNNASWTRLFDFGPSTTVNMFLTPSYSGTNIPRFAITVSGNGAEEQITAPSALANNQWYHIAVTIDDATNTGSMYINGVLVAENTSMTLRPSDLGVTTNNYLGKSQYNDPYLNGQLDEVRIWDRALSQSEIRDWMCKKVENTHAQWCSLISYYRFDENSGTILKDVWGANDGTFVNSPSWVVSGAAIGDESAHDYNGNATSVSQSHGDGSNFTINDFTGTPDGAHIYLINETPNVNTNNLTGSLEESRYYGTFIVGGTAPSYRATYDYSNNTNLDNAGNEAEAKFAKRDNNASTNWNLGSGDFDLDKTGNEISVCNESGNSEYIVGFDTRTIVERPGSGYALDFDGSTQSVTVPHNTSLNLGNTFSFEAWINPETLPSVIGSVISLPSAVDGSGVRLGIRNTGRMEFAVNGAGTMPTNTINLNEWTHLAGTYDGANFRLYQNGVLIGTSAVFSYNANYSQPLFIGVEGAGPVISSRKFDGKIDEVRIWDSALPESEIRDWMCKKVTASHPEYCNLAAYYRFDESTGSTLTDIAKGNNGTLISTPTWETSSTPLGDESTYEYNTVSTGTSINLSHPNGDQMIVNVTAGTADAIHLYRVDEETNATTPPSGIYNISQSNHWGVKVFGGVGCEYQVVYNYDGHPNIAQESHLELLRRDNNADMDWETTTATIDEASNTLTLGGQTGTQFALASNSPTSLPVELMYFTAQVDQEFVTLDWSTSSEINNDYFEIERSPFGNNWTTLERVNGKGSTNTESVYKSYDRNPMEGKSYYRLKQMDLGGKFSYSETRAVVFNSIDENTVSVFPNPAKEQVNIMVKSTKSSAMNVKLINLQGATVMAMDQSLSEGANHFTLHLADLATGMYYISIQKDNTVVNKKLLVK